MESPVIAGGHDWAGAWAVDDRQRPLFPVVPGGERQREIAYRFGVNLVMYTLLGRATKSTCRRLSETGNDGVVELSPFLPMAFIIVFAWTAAPSAIIVRRSGPGAL